jgi:hypothetical protein
MFKVKNIILSLALLGCSGLAQAQQVEQRIDSLQILIGQQTVLHLKASVKQGDKVQLPSFKPQQQITPGVEVVEQSKGDTSHIGDDRMVVSRDYTLTSFDEKVYVIPALNVKVNGKNFHGNQLALKVLTVPVDTVHPNQFYPPKDVQDNPFSWSEWSALFWLSLLLLILCGAWLYLRNRLKNNKPIITHIVFASRYPERYGLGELKDMITFGGSPRASISLAKAARAYAFIKHRGYVIPEDVRAVAHDVMRHRIGLSYEAEASNVTSEEIVSRIINKVEVP